MGKSRIVGVVVFLLLLVALGAGAYYYFGKSVKYEGFRDLKVTSIDDSLLHADVTIALKNSAFMAVKLRQLEAKILGAGRAIGSIEVDSLVELLSDSVAGLKLKLSLRVRESMQFFKEAGDTLDLSISGEAIAGISFLSFPVNIDFAVPVDLNRQVLGGGSGDGEKLFKIKGVEGIRLEGDSLKFDMQVELNNPFNLALKVVAIDSGMVLTRGKITGAIYLPEQITIEKKARGTTALINASCYVGDILKAGPGALFGFVVSGGEFEYEVSGQIIFEVAGERATLPLKYNDSISIGELIKR